MNESLDFTRTRATPLVPPRPTSAGLVSKFFRGLGDPTRVRILQILQDGERAVSELVEEVDGLQGRVSSHLSCLRWCGFVTTRREGRKVYYRLADERVRSLLSLAAEFLADHGDAVELCRVIDNRPSRLESEQKGKCGDA